MRRIKESYGMNEEVYSEAQEAITRLAKFQPTQYGTEETNEKIAREVTNAIFYGIVNMPVGFENREQVYNEVIDRLERMDIY